MKKLLLISILFTLGCTSVASSTAVYIVAKHSEKVERKTRRYTKLNKCFLKNKPQAFMLAESIAHGSPITRDHEIVLNPERVDVDPVPPHHVAYAFFVIADKIGDLRAIEQQKWLAPYLKKGIASNIEDFIDRKYLKSYLVKCFSVPDNHKRHLKARERLLGPDTGFRDKGVYMPLR